MSESVPRQRLSARVLLRRGDEVLLAQIGEGGYGVPGSWTLPGGGVDHGEHPETGLRRELAEETGLDVEVGGVVTVFSERYPRLDAEGWSEDHHGVHLVYTGSLPPDSPAPRVVEVGGTTVDVAWTPVEDITAGRVPVAAVVTHALGEFDPSGA